MKNATASSLRQWIDSVRSAPVVVRHEVVPIFSLVKDLKKRRALERATQERLANAYDVWRKSVAKHDSAVALLEDARAALHGELKNLEDRKRIIEFQLKQKQQQLQGCESEEKSMHDIVNRCVSETKAFQKSLLQCDMQLEPLRDLEKKLKACTEKLEQHNCPHKKIDV